MDQGSPSIESLYDFLYLDRGRVDFYFSQLFEDGVLTQTKRTAKDSSTDTSKLSGSLKLISGEMGGTEQVERGLERMFDPSWLAPIEVLNRLDEFEFIHRDSRATPVGSLFLAKGAMSIIDIRMLKEMWTELLDVFVQNQVGAEAATLAPKEKQRLLTETRKSFEQILKLLQRLPHSIQASFIIEGESLWSTLRPESMLINPDDLALKHGASIPGDWHILAIVDAKPGAVQHGAIGAGPLDVAMAQLLGAVRQLMGRPDDAYGITPIAIFRAIRPTTQQT